VAHRPIRRHRVAPVQEPPESLDEAHPAFPVSMCTARSRAHAPELLGNPRTAMVRSVHLRRKVEQHRFLLNRTSARRLRSTLLV
jgi:hypothetical protein